jgi:hypothetical protein
MLNVNCRQKPFTGNPSVGQFHCLSGRHCDPHLNYHTKVKQVNETRSHQQAGKAPFGLVAPHAIANDDPELKPLLRGTFED